MLLIAGAILLYAYVLTAGRESYRSPRALEVLVGLTAAQGLAVVIVICWILVSGKIHTPRSDWAANEIFIGGAVMLAVLSGISILTYRNLTRRPSPA